MFRGRVISGGFGLAIAAAIVLGASSSAQGAFPGANGILAFEREDRLGNWSIYTAAPTSGGAASLVDASGNLAFTPVWSPDEYHMAWMSVGERTPST